MDVLSQCECVALWSTDYWILEVREASVTLGHSFSWSAHWMPYNRSPTSLLRAKPCLFFAIDAGEPAGTPRSSNPAGKRRTNKQAHQVTKGARTDTPSRPLVKSASLFLSLRLINILFVAHFLAFKLMRGLKVQRTCYETLYRVFCRASVSIHFSSCFSFIFADSFSFVFLSAFSNFYI